MCVCALRFLVLCLCLYVCISTLYVYACISALCMHIYIYIYIYIYIHICNVYVCMHTYLGRVHMYIGMCDVHPCNGYRHCYSVAKDQCRYAYIHTCTVQIYIHTRTMSTYIHTKTLLLFNSSRADFVCVCVCVCFTGHELQNVTLTQEILKEEILKSKSESVDEAALTVTLREKLSARKCQKCQNDIELGAATHRCAECDYECCTSCQTKV